MSTDGNSPVSLVVDRVGKAARRAEEAVGELHATGAEGFLVDAVKRAHEELENMSRRLAKHTSGV